MNRSQRAFALTTIAMVAFAANSVLCRLALRSNAIDPVSFTSIRLMSGALMLWMLLRVKHSTKNSSGTWKGALTLFVYAFAFSYAYVHLDTGTGALLLFGAVQMTMLTYGFFKGERMTRLGTAGLLMALGGLVALLLPGASAPPLTSAAIMLISGVAWGAYSILGKGAHDPLATTAGNFLLSIPFMAFSSLPFISTFSANAIGIFCAIASGVLASGLGYAIWYAALRKLSSFRAATVQLSVPVLASITGILVLGESFSIRLALTSFAVLGGIALVLGAKQKTTPVEL
ncbi:DMT family transporter [Pseudomonas atacamensis]|uniref:DMT family transporter n=2 Tax=Pseudomonas atacamensis TaxID=2565368 RepID=A0AAQ2D7T1_9PSED|nr:DMT family transporter [Pseudomonas atacamensis]